MSLIYAIVAVFGESLAKTLDKWNFNTTHVKPEKLAFLVFTGMFIGSLLYLLFAFPLGSITSFFWLAVIVLVSFFQNFFEFKGLHAKPLSFREPINNSSPIIASFIAFLLFPSERELKYVLAIILGVILITWSSSEGKMWKMAFDRGMLYLVTASTLTAILWNIYKVALVTSPPEHVLIVRIVGVWLLFGIVFRKMLVNFSSKETVTGIFSGIVYFTSGLATLYAIDLLGLNVTILLLLLGPALIYSLSFFFLGEPASPRKWLSSAGVLLLVIVTTLF